MPEIVGVQKQHGMADAKFLYATAFFKQKFDVPSTKT